MRILAAGDPSVFAEAIQRYGLMVIGRKNTNPLDRIVQSESVSAIASTITEDVDDSVGLASQSVEAMRIAEEYGYIVKIIEEMDYPGEDEDMEEGGVATTAPVKPKEKPGVMPDKTPKKPRRSPFNPPRPKKDPAPKACGGM